MQRFLLIINSLLFTLFITAATYNGQTVSKNNTYTRSQSGTTDKNIVKEISGLACSRVTPGYLWAIWDEGTTNMLALRPDGSKAMMVTLQGTNSRDDWEDICTGTYNGVPYVFIGAFGDNQLAFAGNYYIICVPEPAIDAAAKSVQVSLIRFSFPGNAAHNVETLMYDPIESMFYIVDKTESVAPTLYSLPMSLNYGTATQTLTMVRRLGQDADGWDLMTGGDISPDGSLIAIKNQKTALMWTRQGTESVGTALGRQPVELGTYQKEEQGESFAWLDNHTFYTTSDSKKNTPIYVYSQPNAVIPSVSDTDNPDVPTTPIHPTDSNSIAIIDYAASIGQFTYYGTAKSSTSPQKYDNDNVKPNKVINFSNSVRSSRLDTISGDTIVTYNYVTIRPDSGLFQPGDSIVIAGYYNNSSTKTTAVAFYTTIGDNSQPFFTTQSFINGRNVYGAPEEEYYILDSACDSISFGRNGSTSTNVLTLQVFRKRTPSEPATPTNCSSLPADVQTDKFVRDGQIYIRREEHIYDASGRLIR